MNIVRYFILATLSLICLSSTAQLTYKELRVDFDSAWTYKNLQLIPIKFKPKAEAAPGFGMVSRSVTPITLAEAMSKHKIKVQEMQYEQGADVNWLQVTNHSKQDVMIQPGEIVDGGKQDRMIGETKFIAAGKTDYVHVYCIEKRRWSEKPKEFRHRGVVNSDVKKAMQTTTRQSEVWREIDKQFKEKNKTSETWSYLDLNTDTVLIDTGYISFFTRKYVESDSNLAGFIFISGNKILSTEIFSSPSLLNLAFANMLSSYVQSAISRGSKPVVSVATQKEFMGKVISNEEAQRLYVTAHGQLYRQDGTLVHLVAYPD